MSTLLLNKVYSNNVQVAYGFDFEIKDKELYE